MKTIHLSTLGDNHLVAFVDDSDYGFLNRFPWSATKNGNVFYAKRGHKTYMHRLIMGLEEGDKKLVDHIDGDGLNNQRNNLRLISFGDNIANSKPYGASKYKGVTIAKHGDITYYISQLTHNSKRHYLGCFPHTSEGEIEAAKAYDIKAKELRGEFARLNFNNV